MLKPIIGQRFHRLLVRKRLPAMDMYECVCDCGTIIAARGCNLRRGATKSCGCWKRESASWHPTTHGLSSSPEYQIWYGIKKRCYNPNYREFHLYGGRGIKMTARWKSFSTFYKDMGARPSPNHSIERIDNNKDYSKANCRWATKIEQTRNRRTSNWLETESGRMHLKDIAAKLGRSYYTLYDWAVRRGMTYEQILLRHQSPPESLSKLDLPGR